MERAIPPIRYSRSSRRQETFTRVPHMYIGTRNNIPPRATTHHVSFDCFGLFSKTSPTPPIHENPLLTGCSPAMVAYLKLVSKEPKPSMMLAGITLSEEEGLQLEEYLDPITLEVIDIPVMLNENIYNLETLLDILNINSIDPLTTYTFTNRDIQPARKFNNSLRELICEITANHNINESIKEDAELAKKNSELAKEDSELTIANCILM